MAKKVANPDFYESWLRPVPTIQIVRVQYADGREVTLDAVGDDALIQELREYIKLYELDRVFPGLRAYDLRNLARDIAEAEREQVSERNRRTGPRKAKEVSKQDLLAFRELFEYQHGKLHGWKKAACRRFRIGLDALNARLN